MPSRNEHTGDLIQTKPSNEASRRGWDRAFAKKTTQEWVEFEDNQVVIYDPDGWRYDDGVTLDTPISYKEFCKRLNESTVIGHIKDEKIN
jgi:hypothetical protein